MSKLNLKNLKKQALSITQQKKINGGNGGGYMCSMYYCQYVNPMAVCCCGD